MAVLVEQPGALAPLAQGRAAQARVGEGEPPPRDADQEPPQIGGNPPQPVVEPHQHVPSGPRQGSQLAQPPQRIRGVMENAGGDDQVEAGRLESGTEEVHLQEGDVVDLVGALEGLGARRSEPRQRSAATTVRPGARAR